MTFEQFQASRVRTNDISATVGFDFDMPMRAGYVYAQSFFIEVNTVSPERGRYCLTIENCGWINDDLATLERILWDTFANDAINA